MERRLAAILIADVVGYSRLIEADEAGTLVALKERLVSVFNPTIRIHSGRIVKTMGDGVLVEFASAVNAVSAAVDLQQRMTEANLPLPRARHISLRIGINLGDVVGDGDDILGDGVNIAARLEALADAGAIFLSGKIHDEVQGKIPLEFEDLGELRLKNISRPVRTFRLRPQTRTASPTQGMLSLPDNPSIAVLPFENMSGDADQD